MPGSHPRSFLSDSLGADPDICYFSQTTVMCSLGCEFRMHKETESNSGATRTRRSVPLLSFPQRRGPTARWAHVCPLLTSVSLLPSFPGPSSVFLGKTYAASPLHHTRSAEWRVGGQCFPQTTVNPASFRCLTK